MNKNLLSLVVLTTVGALLVWAFWPGESSAPTGPGMSDPVADAGPEQIDPVAGGFVAPADPEIQAAGTESMERERVVVEPDIERAGQQLLVVRGLVRSADGELLEGVGLRLGSAGSGGKSGWRAGAGKGAAGKGAAGKGAAGKGAAGKGAAGRGAAGKGAAGRGAAGKGAAGGAGKGSVGGGQVPYLASTMADGTYEFELRVKSAQESLWLVAEQFGSVSEAQKVAIEGPEVTADFVLQSALVIRGRVVDMEGEGVVDATIAMWRDGFETFLTDADGYFDIGDVDPGVKQFYLEASARGFVARATEVEIAEEENPLEVTIELAPGTVVRGVVLSPAREPVAGASLTLTLGRSKANYQVAVDSDKDGVFEFAGVPEGRRRLVVQHQEFAADDRMIDVPQPGLVLDLTIGLSAGAVLRGLVREEGGGPIEGAVVRARMRGAGKGSPPLRSVETDERGVFEIQGLPDEGLMVVARAEGFLETRESLDAGVRYHEVVMPRVARVAGMVTDVFSGEPVTNFSVRVSLPQHPNAAKRGGGRTQQVQDDNGHWQSPPLPAGTVVNIEVRAKGYAPKVVEGLVARVGAEPGDSVVGLSFGVTLFGLVETQDGMPLANAKLRLVAGEGAPAAEGGKGGGSAGRSTQTDSGGSFEFENVGSGDVRVVVEGGDAGVFVHPTSIPDNVSQWPVMIRVEAQGRIVGVVRRADGQFDGDADVALTAVEVPGLGQRVWQEKADGLGRFSFDDLPFGVYRVGRLQAGDGKREAFARHIAVTSREPLEVELTTTGIAPFGGTLVAEAPIPENTLVRLVPQYAEDVPLVERSTPRHTRWRGGAFLFEGLEPGPYRLSAFFQEEGSGQWVYGMADIEIKAAGERGYVLELDQRK